MKRIIVTGAAGYLGRITSHVLLQRGYTPVGFDNFSTSARAFDPDFEIHEVELCDIAQVRSAFRKLKKVEGIIHFAAKALVPESWEYPELYFTNNLTAAVNIAQAAVEFGVPTIVHSSSCATYGIPREVPITEDSPLIPVSPYGETKVIAEKIFNQFAATKSLKIVNLRYFNPAGALKSGKRWIGEAHDPETHLIPNLVRSVLAKKPLSIYGDDYDTPDGTCIRDFIHVEDLADAHISALSFARAKDPGFTIPMNLGSGTGMSVRQVVNAAKTALDSQLKEEIQPRRAGDPPELVARIDRARGELKWQPKRSLEEILTSHLEFIRSR